jgi:hypothetical protein
MKTILVAEATGPALDWLVAVAANDLQEDGGQVFLKRGRLYWTGEDGGEALRYSPSTDWSQGGPIIDRLMDTCHFFILENDKGHGHHCALSITPHDNHHGTGKTPLIAAMRCYVTSELGEEVEVPDELHNA